VLKKCPYWRPSFKKTKQKAGKLWDWPLTNPALSNAVNYSIGFAGLGGTELVKKLGNPEGGLPFTLVLNAQGGLIVQKLGKLSSQEMREWV
jgi:hypothetical protein